MMAPPEHLVPAATAIMTALVPAQMPNWVPSEEQTSAPGLEHDAPEAGAAGAAGAGAAGAGAGSAGAGAAGAGAAGAGAGAAGAAEGVD